MMTSKTSALLLLYGVMLLWPNVLINSASSQRQTGTDVSLSAVQEEERPHVAQQLVHSCDQALDNYCLNNGQCMLLVDINEHHCKCKRGFYGPRCSHVELVFQPVKEKHVIVTAVCVIALVAGLAAVLLVCCQWYKRQRRLRQQKQHGYEGVQTP
ncbi:proepiregulin-like [Thalassophryne amazonica]|uniref:proepiregulin-like n=1 Tax=Thalassophryne amazonica TaxID=390379 RepID=UPI001471BF36|nr:proepiregulin-like [Thalassophryne amazonica]